MKDIDEIRRENLRRLEQERGSATEAAKAAGMSLAQFANLRNGAKDSKTGKPRGMRKETARRIEESLGKPMGWLDLEHAGQQENEAGNTNAVIDKQEILEALVATIVGLPQPVRNLLADDMALLARAPGDADTQSRVLALLMQSPCAAGIRTQDFAGKPPALPAKRKAADFLKS